MHNTCIHYNNIADRLHYKGQCNLQIATLHATFVSLSECKRSSLTKMLLEIVVDANLTIQLEIAEVIQ